MTRQDAHQFVQWLNRILDYVPPIHMREAQNLVAAKVITSLANGEITIDIKPALPSPSN